MQRSGFVAAAVAEAVETGNVERGQQFARLLAVEGRQANRLDIGRGFECVDHRQRRAAQFGRPKRDQPSQRAVGDEHLQQPHAGIVGELEIVDGERDQTAGCGLRNLRTQGIREPGSIVFAPHRQSLAPFGQQPRQLALGSGVGRQRVGCDELVYAAGPDRVGHGTVARSGRHDQCRRPCRARRLAEIAEQPGLAESRLARDQDHAALGDGAGECCPDGFAADASRRPQHARGQAAQRRRHGGSIGAGSGLGTFHHLHQRDCLVGGRDAELAAQHRLAALEGAHGQRSVAGRVVQPDQPSMSVFRQHVEREKFVRERQGCRRIAARLGGQDPVDQQLPGTEMPLLPLLIQPAGELAGEPRVGLAQQVRRAVEVVRDAGRQRQRRAADDDLATSDFAELEDALAQRVAGGLVVAFRPEQAGHAFARGRPFDGQPRQQRAVLADQRRCRAAFRLHQQLAGEKKPYRCHLVACRQRSDTCHAISPQCISKCPARRSAK